MLSPKRLTIWSASVVSLPCGPQWVWPVGGHWQMRWGERSGVDPAGSLPVQCGAAVAVFLYGLPLSGPVIASPHLGLSGLGVVTAFQRCWSLVPHYVQLFP